MTFIEFLKEKKISQYKLSKRVGVSRQAISDIVNGKIKPSYCLMVKMKEQLNISYDFLFQLLESTNTERR